MSSKGKSQNGARRESLKQTGPGSYNGSLEPPTGDPFVAASLKTKTACVIGQEQTYFVKSCKYRYQGKYQWTLVRREWQWFPEEKNYAAAARVRPIARGGLSG
jgi:hypothetical protein